MRSSYLREFTCNRCGKPMQLDDVDYNFRGNQDEYYICACGASCIVKIRYWRKVNEDWYSEEKQEVDR